MNALEQKHYDAIQDRKHFTGHIETYHIVPKGSPERCAQLTKNIAIAYQEWYSDNVIEVPEESEWGYRIVKKYERLSDDELFHLFIEKNYK